MKTLLFFFELQLAGIRPRIIGAKADLSAALQTGKVFVIITIVRGVEIKTPDPVGSLQAVRVSL